ncbi:radical SAM protein [Actinomadura sp. KC216]|uniref:radical SAM protein n=1 Tax=Actinomadura sp. KC216 TaxID=2530370 RepID=UPI0010440137|nr:radical SAM protein [Actinomadura sp. KC216]TDB80744.1 radical SAM protein [Actinomadura sp. KC216]
MTAGRDPAKSFTTFLDDVPSGPPVTAYMNIIRRCNARCQYCTDWTAPRNPHLDPSRDRLRTIFTELKRLGVRDVVLSGGEPFLRRDLDGVLRDAHQLGFGIRIISNGTLIRPGHIELIRELGIDRVGVSIDSLSAERMKAIRGLRVHQVTRAIETLAEARTRHPSLRVSIYVTVNRLNIEDLVPLAEYAKGLRIDVQYQPVHFAETGLEEHILTELWPDERDIERLGEVVEELLLRKRTGDLPINNRPEFLATIPAFFRNRTFHPERCTVAYTDVVIDGELNLKPCWSMPPVKNLAAPDTDLVELWHSGEMREIRRDIREHRCPGCLYVCHLNKPHVPLPELRHQAP